MISEGEILWEPSTYLKQTSGMSQYMHWLEREKGLVFPDFLSLWRWSVDDLESFWASIWEYFQIQSPTPYTRVMEGHEMPGVRWFPGARVNFAQHVFRGRPGDRPALLFQSEHRPLTIVSWDELSRSVASVAAHLREYGVRPGDRVVAYMPNLPETVIAFLAAASIGAVWSSCSPDFGAVTVVDRFKQIEPKVLFAVDGYQYGGKVYDRTEVVQDLQRSLPTLEKTVFLPYIGLDGGGVENAVMWNDIVRTPAELHFEPVEFEHPLWVLYSSGTTGHPKGIVHGHGNIVLELLKVHQLHFDVQPGDRFFWFTTTGWMMWNFTVGALLSGATILLYDGHPGYPNLDVLWEFAEKTGMTSFGTSAGYIQSCLKAGLEPGKDHDLSKLRAIGSTGSPLTIDGFEWVYQKVKKDIWLAPGSGGTDVCTPFVGPCPLLPVKAGLMQGPMLGVKAEAYDDNGQPIIGEVGELVITRPMPSMPLYFWNDPEMSRYRESYFEMYPGVWRHGDWIKFYADGSCVIYGRSDSTINRHGVRMGTSEIYRAVEGLDEIADSLVVDLELLGRPSFLSLFVVLKPGVVMTDQLKAAIRKRIRETVSPRHVPDEVYVIDEVPRTLNGKKMEVPIRKILLGYSLERAVNPDSMSNPQSLEFFIELAKQLNT
ncbi:MAG TPA: acetoacetate--CoA ligase [Alicyclobacillus sp.]|nr:acetoacetate--CoA ligase [Alicyclobacillus sp.]